MNLIINHDLVLGRTNFTKDTASSATTILCENTEQIQTSSGLLVFGMIGSSNAELIPVISSKTATQVVVGTGLSYNHSKGEPIQQVSYNKVYIESSTSATGTFSVIATIDIQWASDTTLYTDPNGTSTTYYRQRFYNTVTGAYSDYTNGGVGVAEVDIDKNTVGGLIRSVKKSVGNTELSDDFFINALQDARAILDTEFGYGRINEWRHVFEYPIQMLAGTNYVDLPTNIDFTETNRTLLNARFARQSVAANTPLKYCDKREWNMRSYLNRYSTTATEVLTGATSIQLASTGDFGATGSINVATDDPTQDIMVVTYTGNNLLTNTLTGVSGVTRDIPINTQCWAYSSFSIPFFYTVFNDPETGTPRLWFDRPIPDGLQGKNLYIDYYKVMSELTNLSDTIPEHHRDIYKNYLRFAIKRRRNDTIGEDDSDYKRFMSAASIILGNPHTGQSQIIIQ